jgi:hypothetical protein
MNYPPDPDRCPTDVADSLVRYIADRIPPGGFLRAVIEDRLSDSMASADEDNYEHLGDIVAWIYHNMPMNLRGPEGYRNHVHGKK